MENLQEIINALSKVSNETNDLARSLTESLTDSELAQMFNQKAADLFNYVNGITRRLGIESEYKISGYIMLFDNARKFNFKLPLTNFYKAILPFAPQIYAENVDYFLKMDIPDANVSSGNDYTLIRSESFKRLWSDNRITVDERRSIVDSIILLTTYSHAYFFSMAK